MWFSFSTVRTGESNPAFRIRSRACLQESCIWGTLRVWGAPGTFPDIGGPVQRIAPGMVNP